VRHSEAKSAVAAGAAELDMVMNHAYLAEPPRGNDGQDFSSAYHDIHAVRQAAKSPTILKVILETSALTREGIIAGCLVAKEAGADFVKTSTGLGGGGATVEDVALMKAGATRIGTSNGVTIVHGPKLDEPWGPNGQY